MLRYKRIFMSIGIVLLFALLIQLLRINTLVEWSKATNRIHSIDAAKAVSAENPKIQPKEDGYIIYYDLHDPVSKQVLQNITSFLDSIKKEYIAYEAIAQEELMTNQTVIIAARHLDTLGDLSPIVNYLHEGGSVIFALSMEQDHNFKYISQALGIHEYGYMYYTKGMHMPRGILQGGTVDIEGDWLQNSSLSVRLSEECQVFARADDGNPLFWRIRSGKGNIIMLNGTFLLEKSGMGMFSSALSMTREAFIYPIINAKITFLHHFLLPLYGDEAYMKKLYGRSTEGFIRDIWWPDMIKAANQYDFKYTAFFIASTDTKVAAPFEKDASSSTNLSFLGREILRYGGELALSGYNEIPLIFKNLKNKGEDISWESKSEAEKALAAAQETFKERFSQYALRCYSPPYGMFSEEGYEVLHSSMKDLAVINGSYEGDEKLQLIQDFHIDQHGLVHIPTVSKGFSLHENQYWKLMNGATSFGIISHSFDLKDIMREQAHQRDWKELGKDFESLGQMLYREFGWLQSMTASQAAEEIKRYERVKPSIYIDQDKIEVYNEDFIGPVSFMLRFDREAKALKGCTLIKLEKGFYLVQALEPVFAIELGGTI